MNRLCAGVLAALVIPAALPQEDFVPAAALHEAGLVKFWQLALPLAARQRLVDAYLVDDQLYLATQDGYVFAVHADTGAIRWLRQVTHSGYRVKRPCHAGARTIFVTPTTVLQVDRQFGDAIAELDLSFPAGSAAVSDGSRFYLGGINQRFYAFSVENQFEVWKAATNGPINSTPALYNDLLFVGSDDGGVYACVAANKHQHWRAATTGPITADIAVDENGIYAASQDQSLYLFDFQVGQVRWRARFSGPLYVAPVLTPEVAYQYCPDDGLVAVDTAVLHEGDRFRWKLPRGRTALTVHAGYAYVLTQDQTLLAVRIADGDVAHTIPAAGFALPMPAPKAASVYLASADGRIFCARPIGAAPVDREAVRRALLPRPAEQPLAEAAVTQPAAGAVEEIPDFLKSQQGGVPVGGKSKVTREFKSGAEAGKGGSP